MKICKGEAWTQKVKWLKGDLLSSDDLQGSLKGVDAVVSTVGAIGTDETILRSVNGEANVKAVKEAKGQH